MNHDQRLGLGTYRMTSAAAKVAVEEAIKVGYRLVDTASVYRNEDGVGYATENPYLLPRSCVNQIYRRKLMEAPRNQGFANATAAFNKSLQTLKLDYTVTSLDCTTEHQDLYLIHWPGVSGKKPSDPENAKLRQESWAALEQVKNEGKTRYIGISNYQIQHLRSLLEYANVKPYLLQIEFHPCLFDKELLEFCKDSGIILQAYSSLGEGSLIDGSLGIPGIDQICTKHGMTRAQVFLRWALEHEVAVIPKASSQSRMKENLDSLKYHLDDDDLQTLDSVGFSHRFCWDPTDVL